MSELSGETVNERIQEKLKKKIEYEELTQIPISCTCD